MRSERSSLSYKRSFRISPPDTNVLSAAPTLYSLSCFPIIYHLLHLTPSTEVCLTGLLPYRLNFVVLCRWERSRSETLKLILLQNFLRHSSGHFGCAASCLICVLLSVGFTAVGSRANPLDILYRFQLKPLL